MGRGWKEGEWEGDVRRESVKGMEGGRVGREFKEGEWDGGGGL